ncbi:PTS system protein [Klebsiella michiganensis]|nr:PTS system protein [Klebsiella michiganensis]
MDTLVFASLMGLYYWFARLRLGYTFSAMLLQPVVIAVFVGLLLGNMETAMIIGAGMQLVYLGVTSTPGGNVPSDPAAGSLYLDSYRRKSRDGPEPGHRAGHPVWRDRRFP